MQQGDKPRTVRVALVQMRCNDEPEANLERGLAGIASAAAMEAQIVCLPELFRTRYFCQTENPAHFSLAEPIPGPTTDRLAHSARANNLVVVAGLFERRAAGLYHNTCVIIDASGEIVGRYRKMHIPDDPGFYEKFYFSPGDLGFCSVATACADVGVLICWDQWFPEAARLTALRGAAVILFPTAIGTLETEDDAAAAAFVDAWQTIQRGHAIANGVFVAAVNRVGNEDGLNFWGRSFVAGPLGEWLARGDAAEQIIIADCDLSRIESVRRAWPFLRDRRLDAYVGLDRRYLDKTGS